jgi:hypothetical protein
MAPLLPSPSHSKTSDWKLFASALITGASLVASTPVKLEVGVLFGPNAFCSAKPSTLLFLHFLVNWRH